MVPHKNISLKPREISYNAIFSTETNGSEAFYISLNQVLPKLTVKGK